MALSHCLRAGAQRDLSVNLEPQIDGFVENAAGDFEKAADADAAQLSRPLGCRAARRKSVPVGGLERLVHDALELAAVVDRPVRRLVRHRAGRDEIATPQLHAIDPQRPCGTINQPLDHVDRFRASRSAIGSKRCRIGSNHLHADVDRRDRVDAREAVLGIRRGEDRGECGGVGADAYSRAHPQAEEAAVGVKREFTLQDAVAAVGIGKKTFEPRRAPFGGTAGPARRIQQGGVFRISLRLHAEAAADVGGENADLLRSDLEHTLSQHAPHHCDALRGSRQGVALALGIPARNRGTGLHRGWRKSRVEQPHAFDVRCLCECLLHRVCVAVLPIENDIARGLGPYRIAFWTILRLRRPARQAIRRSRPRPSRPRPAPGGASRRGRLRSARRCSARARLPAPAFWQRTSACRHAPSPTRPEECRRRRQRRDPCR